MFHYLLEDFKEHITTQKRNWEGYVKVNQFFAKTVAEFYQPGDYSNLFLHYLFNLS